MIKILLKKSPKIIEKPVRFLYYSIPDYRRYSNVFRENYDFLNESQWWDKQKQKEYQILQLQKIIKHSYETVPYYTNLFNEYGIDYKQIQDFSDMKKIPYLTKQIIQDNLEDLISNKFYKNEVGYATTGGSTGTPMGFYIDSKYDKAREWAFIAHMWSRVGYDVRRVNRCVILRGNVPNKGIYEYKNRDLILSSFKLTEENMDKYIDLIEKFDPDFIQAYPSSIIILSKYINETNRKINCKNLKSIICASENIYEAQRNDIEKAFGVRVYSFYGHTEHACIGGECEKSNYYHIQSEYGYMELIDEYDNQITNENGLGEIVATGFNNYVVPFIRYKTCDIAVNTNEKCSCGRNYKLIKKIDGRKQEYFVDLHKNKVTFTWADYPLWQCKDRIWAYQYIQNEPGKVILNINFKDVNDLYDLNKIKEVFIKYYPQINIETRKVGYIARTKRGKFKYLIQNI
ncbi:phenylacetate--CoA ligase family protein [Clostridium massiliodielmoense]|uniref:phenylacetate--CoA ligase family protein n=1 Tax=Clostridium massiliodielmoense TaxID=1776385 RepID=UPI0004D7928A|nr:phenylacetate--CoA ligase family protein [Clostridium massiliodielmoense]KEH92370.1 capsular biosynthesis protein [Clostridium botulinum C/D str. BKT12695]